MEGRQDAREHVPDVVGDRQNTEDDNAEVALELTHLEDLLPVSAQQEVVCIEVDAEHQDEHSDDRLHERRVAGAAVVPDTEPSGPRTAESDTDCIKQRHAREQEKDDLRDGECEVDRVQYFGRVPHARHKLAHGGPRALRAHETHVVSAGHGKDRKNKDDDAHTSDPVGKAAPEQAGVAERLHVAEYTRSRRCKAGGGLKDRVGEVRYIARRNKGERPQDTENEPAQTDDRESLPGIEHMALHLSARQITADCNVENGKCQIGKALFFKIDRAADHGEHHECSDHFDHDAQNSAYD